MTDKTLFNDDWLRLQRDYWAQLSDMGRQVMGATGAPFAAAPAAPSNPWQAAIDQWWRALSPAASDPAKLFMDRMIEQGKNYFRLSEQFMRQAGGDDGAKGGWDAWSKAMADMQRAFSGAGTGASTGTGAGTQGWMGFWEMPLDNWQRTMSALSPMIPGDWLRNMPHDAMRDGVKQLLSAPGLGYNREEQGRYQDLVRCGIDYQRALQEYQGFFSQLGTKSVSRMQAFIKEQADAGKTIDSARALYDHWVACCEAVYAEEVRTPEYSRINGHLVNSLMALKQRMAVMVDESLGAMNMPTRSELRTVQDRLQEARRDNRQLRHDLEEIKRRLAIAPLPAPAAERAVGGVSTAPMAALAAPKPVKPAAPRKRPTGKGDGA